MLSKLFEQLKQDIIVRANLGSTEATGFHAVHCPICNKTDRRTGGFKFEDDKIGYHCFRGSCDASTVYELGKPIPKKFKRLMESIGTTIPTELRMIKSSFHKALENLNEDLYKKHYYKDIEPLENFVTFDNGLDRYQDFWKSYYESRHVGYDDVLICNKGKYSGCSAIQMNFYDKTIGYQIVTPKGDYIKHYGGNTNLLYIPENKLSNTVLVVEGTLDAKCFPNTVATMQSKISPEQAYHLRGKNVIMIPDMDKNNQFINQFSQYGWKISLPDWNGLKDLNEAVSKYGTIVVAEMIMESLTTDKNKAMMLYKMRTKEYENCQKKY